VSLRIAEAGLIKIDGLLLVMLSVYSMKNTNAIGNVKNVNKFLVCMIPSLIKLYILDSETMNLNRGN
jgi:hypothetical protein